MGATVFHCWFSLSKKGTNRKGTPFFQGRAVALLVAFGLCALPGPEGPGIKHARSVTVMDLASLLHRLYNVSYYTRVIILNIPLRGGL